MAANMMELLNLMHDMLMHINSRLNIMEGKISELDKNLMQCKITALEKKMDHQDVTQQLILATMDSLKNQIRKNNLLLFGNDGTENNLEDKTTDSHKPVLNELGNAEHSMKQSENSEENVETTQLQNPSVEINQETELNCEHSGKCNDNFENKDKDGKILNKSSVIGTENNDATRNTQCEKTAAIPINTSTCFSTDLALLDDKLNNITDMYQSDMKELEQLIMDVVTEIKISVEEAVNVVYKQDTEQINNTYTELKELAETNNSVMKELKDIIKNYVTKKMPAQTVKEQELVQISPTYFSDDQLSKLNSRLKLVAEACQEANILCPIIEVISVHDQHPIVKQLIEGVYYEKINRCSESLMFRFKFGTCDSEKSYIIGLIARYPNLLFNEVVKICLLHCNKYEANSKIYDLSKPMIYNKRGDLVRLIM